MNSRFRFIFSITVAFGLISACAHDHPHGPHTHTHDRAGSTGSVRPGSWDGLWSVSDAAGNPFHIRLMPGQKATNDRVSRIGKRGDHGIWGKQNGAAFITWDSGYHDKIYPGAEGYEYASWAPGQTPDDEPETTTSAVKVQ